MGKYTGPRPGLFDYGVHMRILQARWRLRMRRKHDRFDAFPPPTNCYRRCFGYPGDEERLVCISVESDRSSRVPPDPSLQEAERTQLLEAESLQQNDWGDLPYWVADLRDYMPEHLGMWRSGIRGAHRYKCRGCGKVQLIHPAMLPTSDPARCYICGDLVEPYSRGQSS